MSIVKICGRISSCPHFLHIALFKRHITCSWQLNVQWQVAILLPVCTDSFPRPVSLHTVSLKTSNDDYRLFHIYHGNPAFGVHLVQPLLNLEPVNTTTVAHSGLRNGLLHPFLAKEFAASLGWIPFLLKARHTGNTVLVVCVHVLHLPN
jgi:hypothetical protein